MRIIRRGTPPEEQLINTTCTNCNTEFEFYKKEARLETDRNEILLVIECPICNKQCWIKI